MSGFVQGVASVFQRRLRGFRVVDLAALALLLTLVMGVYAFKAAAGQEGGKLRDVDQAIADETRAIRIVRSDVARLEQPERLQRLSTAYLGLQAEDARHETQPDALSTILHPTEPPPAPPAMVPALTTLGDVAR